MKLKVKDLRKTISEEFLRGIPEFMLRQATTKYVDEIRQHVFKFILENKSTSKIEQRQSIAAANEVLKDLEDKANELLEEQLFQFIKQV